MNSSSSIEAIRRMMVASYMRYKRGDITDQQARTESTLLGNILKTYEAAEEDRRLAAIQDAIELTNDYE